MALELVGKRPATGKNAPKEIIQYGRLDMEAPHIGNIIGYRSLWALASLDQKSNRLKCQYFTYCTVMGRTPLWGLYRVSGSFVRDFGLRSAIEQAYPHLTWRRVNTRFVFEKIAPQKAEDKFAEAMEALKERGL